MLYIVANVGIQACMSLQPFCEMGVWILARASFAHAFLPRRAIVNMILRCETGCKGREYWMAVSSYIDKCLARGSRGSYM